jgi:hypothetical protein
MEPPPANPTQREAAEVILAIDRLKEQLKGEHEANRAQEAKKAKREKATVAGIWVYTILTMFIAGASIYQARVFKETEKRQLRAYIGLGSMTVQCCKKFDDPPTVKADMISIPLGNDGQTPAYFLYSLMSRMEFSKDEEFPDDFQCSNEHKLLQKERHGAIINPKKEFSPGFGIDKDAQQQIIESRDGQFWLVFCGKAIYRDIFSDAWAHQFCFQYRNPAVSGEIGFCPTGNEEMPIATVTTVEDQKSEQKNLLPEVPRNKL